VQRQALVPLRSSPEAAIEIALGLLREVYEMAARRGRPVFGLAVGVVGLVDISTGTLLFAPNLGWRNVPLYELLRREFDLPIYISNEANLAALGESYFGPPGSSDFLLYISSGVGIGGGIVLNGALLTGPIGFTGEVGHMTVDRDGLPCACGSQGCWETVASQRALFRRVQAATSTSSSVLHALTDGNPDALTVPLVVQAAQRGDPAALAALDETGRWLGVGIASLINIICPRRVVFGGMMALAHSFLLPVIREEVARHAFPHVRDAVEIALATYGADAAVMGGVALVHREVLNHPMRWL
jgi:glucokinase-like ROK family protein